MAESSDVTILLDRINEGDGNAPEELLPLVYSELRKLAHSYLQNERADHTLQATALVHEAYIRLVDWEKVSWQNRAHFFAVAANVMRKILVDHAREKKAQKRDFGQKFSLDEAVSFPTREKREVDLIALDDALEKLAKFDKTQSKIVELRFFGGLTIEETAHALKISSSTVKREWAVAKTWLFREIRRRDG
ncbi:MAG TPA: sigma-70 family RNA polymerase sigma factor [Pyrinomonadaceae bacterium]|jgi:RNA polymerase sigma factor (TIGR02999 family)|nr:sigma-70 family RNA polymerase sigma factor [Pyrinomonadaceae bacterium]